MNRNDRHEARQDFEAAYKIDPQDAFTLNNMGFLAELNGDRETADFYYEKAREAKRRKDKVTVATRRDAEGQPVGAVAESSNQKVEARMQQELEMKRREGGPIELRRRDHTPVSNDNSAPQNSIQDQSGAANQEPAPPSQSIPEDSTSPNGIAAPSSPSPTTR